MDCVTTDHGLEMRPGDWVTISDSSSDCRRVIVTGLRGSASFYYRLPTRMENAVWVVSRWLAMVRRIWWRCLGRAIQRCSGA